MRTRKDTLDNLVYTIACVCSAGTLWVTRILISTAIRKALENK